MPLLISEYYFYLSAFTLLFVFLRGLRKRFLDFPCRSSNVTGNRYYYLLSQAIAFLSLLYLQDSVKTPDLQSQVCDFDAYLQLPFFFSQFT